MGTKERVNLTMDPDLVEQVDRAAKSDSRSRSNWVEVACREKLERERRANADRATV